MAPSESVPACTDLRRWFVMLVGAKGQPLPMTNENGGIFLFKTENEAYDAGGRHALGQAYGYEVFEWTYLRDIKL